MRCIPAGAAHQIAKRPSSWWFVSTIRNAPLPRTKNVGAPWLSRSLASGSARQIFRSRLSVRSRSADETTRMMVARGNALVALLLSGAVAAGPPSPATATSVRALDREAVCRREGLLDLSGRTSLRPRRRLLGRDPGRPETPPRHRDGVALGRSGCFLEGARPNVGSEVVEVFASPHRRFRHARRGFGEQSRLRLGVPRRRRLREVEGRPPVVPCELTRR